MLAHIRNAKRQSARLALISPLALLALLASCQDYIPPPPHIAYGDLPASGSLSDARYAGFNRCIEQTTKMRCIKEEVFVEAIGPFKAAVDLKGSDGSGGFQELTLWHDWDQNAVFPITKALKAQGWHECLTGSGRKGDQAIYTLRGAAVSFTMDISYFGKRRLRVIPASSPQARC